MTKKIEGEKEKTKRTAVKVSLTTLVGKSYIKMSKTEQETFVILLGQIVGLLDENGKVKPI